MSPSVTVETLNIRPTGRILGCWNALPDDFLGGQRPSPPPDSQNSPYPRKSLENLAFLRFYSLSDFHPQQKTFSKESKERIKERRKTKRNLKENQKQERDSKGKWKLLRTSLPRDSQWILFESRREEAEKQGRRNRGMKDRAGNIGFRRAGNKVLLLHASSLLLCMFRISTTMAEKPYLYPVQMARIKIQARVMMMQP